MLIVLTSMVLCSYAQENTPAAVTSYIAKFETAVLTHNYDSVMIYMDKGYVKSQYKKMLKKNKTQFIDELFGGMQAEEAGGAYINTTLPEISMIKHTEIKKFEGEHFQVTFAITTATGAVHYRSLLLFKSKKGLGFIGSEG